MISEWETPAELQTPEGTLPFNQPVTTDGGVLLLSPRRCSSVLPVRKTDDDVPQADGQIPHRRFRAGYQVHLAFELLSEYDPETGEAETATGSELVDLMDLVGLHVNSMIRTSLVPGAPNARYVWTPTDHDDRMVDRCQLAGDPTYSFDGDLGCSLYEVDIDTSFPYYVSVENEVVAISHGETETVTNGGNTDFFPVVEVYGPFSSFTLTNNSVIDMDGNPATLVYDDLLPGAASVAAPDFIEFLFWNNTAYLNNNQANMKAGIDMLVSEFFPLVPGDNELSLTIVDGDGTNSVALVTVHHAWA